MAGNEASAIGSLRAVNTAQQGYSQLCNGFAPTLVNLGGTGIGGAQPFLSPDMTVAGGVVVKSGYTTHDGRGRRQRRGHERPSGLVPRAPTDDDVVRPADGRSPTGTRGFATNNGGTIFQDTAGGAPASRSR